MSRLRSHSSRALLCGAALVALIAAMLLGRSLPAQESGKDKAKTHFDRAIRFFKDGKYEDALLDFEASYEYRPHWALKYNMALCHYYLKHDLKALTLLTEYLEEGGGNIKKDDKAMAEKFLKELKAKFGILVLTGVKDDTLVKIDGELLEKTKSNKEIYLKPGKRSVFIMTGIKVVINKEIMFDTGKKVQLYAGVIEKEEDSAPIVEKGGEEKETGLKGQEIETTAEGKGQDHEPAPAERWKKLRTPAWITLGLGAALLVGGAAAGAVTLKEKSLSDVAYDDYIAGYYGSATPEELVDLDASYEDHSNKAKQAFIASAVLLPVGGILTAASIVLFALSSRKPKAMEQKSATSLSVTPWPLGLELSF